MKKYLIGIILGISWSGCVTLYQPIKIESLAINDYRYSLKESNVEIALDYDVLIGSSNKMYSKREKKNNVSLVVLNVQNLGEKELLLPEDLLIQINTGDSIQPLQLEQAMQELVDPVKNKSNIIDVEVEIPFLWQLIWGLGKIINFSKKVISNVRFSNDMSEHYLEHYTLETGQSTTGFLVLPVKKGTPLKISLR
jgi:hypothetical protein